MNILKKIYVVALMALITMPMYAGVMSGITSFDVRNEDINSVIARNICRKKDKAVRLQAPLNENKTTDAYTWGTLRHENGHTWYYTQTYEDRGWYYGASDITIYDNNFNPINTIRIEIPEGLNVNDIEPTGFITTNFFDGDATTAEMPIFIHAVDNGKQINKLGIYRFNGEKIMEYAGYSMINFKASDSYNRILLVRYATENEKTNHLYIDILAPTTADATAPVVEHTFAVDQDLLLYSDGSCINYFSFDGEPYYTISHYENVCMNGYDPSTYVPIQAPDNRFTIKTYNARFAMVDSVSIKIDPTMPDATYGFATFGLYSSKDLRMGDFTNDKQFNYIVTHYEYFAQSDEYTYHIRAYDSESNLVNTLNEDVTTWFILSDVAGYEEQVAFLKNDEAGAQYLEMVNVPSCQVATVLPSVIDGNLISTTLDRCLVGSDYQYVIALSQATENADGDAIARIGWYKKDASVDHYVEFNIGKNAEGFTPYIASYALNPYLFNTDDKREYFYLAMNKRTDGSDVLDKTLYLADEDGKVLRTIRPDAGDEIEFSSGDVFDYNTDSPRMLLSFYNGDKDAFEIHFYNLPFDKFTSGGDGTAENPYVITTPGELAQMHSEPAAHYVLGNDIDMSTYTFPYYGAEEFTGIFDGNNHVISNLVLDNGGLFATTNGATIKNLQIQSPILNIGYTDCGIVVDRTNNTTIENVHIYDAVFDGVENTDTYVGGLVGVAEKTTIQVGSMVRASVNNSVSNFGGIVGNAISSQINATVTGGVMPMGNIVGGIAAVADRESVIENCHTLWNMFAGAVNGGIVGLSQFAQITRCYSDGIYDVLIETPPYAGYIVGILDVTYAQGNEIVVSNCVAVKGDVVGNYDEAKPYVSNNYTCVDYANDGEYKAVEEMDKAFFESLGYAYGNTVDAPWCGEGLPKLYFENDHQSVAGVNSDKTSIIYDGVSVSAANAASIALFNMQGQLVATTHSEELNVADVAAGVYVVVAVDNNDERQSRKIVVK